MSSSPGKISAPLSLNSPGAACAGFLWIFHRLNCESPTAWRNVSQWLAVSSSAGTIPRAAPEQLFATGSSSRTGNRRCYCYTTEAMGRVDSKLFPFPCTLADTRAHPRPSTFVERFPFRHLSTPPVISSCRYLNTVHIRTMPDAFFFRRQ